MNTTRQSDIRRLRRTPLYDLHRAYGARMVAFAGYEMPVYYTLGLLKEHQHTRSRAGLFDVSHMGQLWLTADTWQTLALEFERLVPQDVLGLERGRQRYGFLTTANGGLMDDLMFARYDDSLLLVVNAAHKSAVTEYVRKNLEPVCQVKECYDRALLALQGPAAASVLAQLDPEAADMRFMDSRFLQLDGVSAMVSRSGYTGEDGYEMSILAADSEHIACILSNDEAVEFIGLGARDSLRLEAGLCLYGNDITAQTSPIEAALSWAIQRVRRRKGARAGGFPGSDRLLEQLDHGAGRRRVGLTPQGRAPMREDVPLFAHIEDRDPIGQVTSGGFGPTVGCPISMGYVPVERSEIGTTLVGEVRGKRLPVMVAELPFVAAKFKRD